jgi:DeoR family glycerol-3-phosphate regulon repressor
MATAPPLRVERLNRIKAVLERQPAIRASELAAQLGVSRETVRRDFAALEESGLLVRSHGGAMRAEAALAERPQELREKLQAHEKGVIAHLALDLVDDGAAIALDSSSTALALARRLRGREITVITNGLHAAQALAGDDATRVILAGGLLHHGNMSFIGPEAEAAAGRRFPDYAFLSAPALAERGVMDTNGFEVAVKQALVQGAQRICVLADNTKFDRTAFEMVLGWPDVDVLISDRPPAGEWTELLEDAGVELRAPADASGGGSEAGGEGPRGDSSQRRGTWP